MKISKLDHLVLTVRDIEKAVLFYESVMGMKKEIFSKGRVALRFGDQKINLHEFGGEVEPKSLKPTPGSADLCFITSVSIEEAMAHVKSCRVEIIEGPVERSGAHGPIMSFYFRDLDQNLIEVAVEL